MAADARTLAEPGIPLHPRPSFPPEMEMLLCCGGPRLQEQNQERLKHLCAAGPDWDLAARIALWHHMVPLLYWGLSRLEEGSVPAEIMEVFKDAFIRNVSWSLTMTAELLSILEEMERRDIVVVPYKGPVLSSQIYGNLSLRQSSDLDILVRRTAVEEARSVLIDQGYVPSVMLHGANHDFQVESRYSERFDRPGSVVELHWAFTNKDIAFPLSLDELMPRLEVHHVSSRPIRVFSPEDTLLILCVHGAKHGWGRLEWICGIAELIQREEQLSWPELISRATETKSRRRLLLGLALAHDFFGASLPLDIKEQIRHDRQIPSLAVTVAADLFDGENNKVEGIHTFGTLDHDLFHFRLGDRLPDSLRYLMYRVTTPSRPERWSTVPLGGYSIRLHSFTRPFGIVMKLIPAMWRRFGARRTGQQERSS